MKLFHHALSDKGKSRNYQEDDWMVLPIIPVDPSIEHAENKNKIRQSSAYIIADGMGGAVGGDIASHIAVVSVSDYILEYSNCLGSKDKSKLLGEAIQSANAAILNKVLDNTHLKGMGSTIVIGLIEDNILHLSWVGDSRCYMYSQSSGIKLLTKDHSYVQSLVDQGILEESLAASHPNKNLILRSLGQENVEGEYCSNKISEEDMYLFCTDGLNTMLTDQELEKILSEDTDLESMTTKLINQANNNGGLDNITIILVKCAKSEQPSHIPSPVAKNSKQVSAPKSKKVIVYFVLGCFLVFSVFGGFWYKYKDKKQDENEHEIAIIAIDSSAVASDDINNSEPIENLKVQIEALDSAFVTKDTHDLAISYEVRMGVFTTFSEAEKELEKHKIDHPNIAFELRTNEKTGYSLYAVNFNNKHSAQDFLSVSKNENGVIIFNKFSEN